MNSNNFIKFFICICVSLACYATSARAQDILCKNISFTEGLLSYRVNDIEEDKWGNIWIATDKGLNRIMGNEIVAYTNSSGSGELKNNTINDIIIDNEGDIWVFDGAHVYKYDAIYDKLVSLKYQGNAVRVAHAALSGDNLILLNSQYAYTYNITANSITNRFQLREVSVKGVCTLSDTLILVNDKFSSIYSIDLVSGETKKQLNGKFINQTSIFVDSESQVWISEYGALGRYRWCAESATLEKISEIGDEQAALTSFIITDIVEHDNKLWLTTDGGGVHYMDLLSGEVYYLMSYAKLQNNNLLSTLKVFFDSSNNIWLGGVRSGITFIKEVHASLLTKVEEGKAGLSNAVVLSVVEDKEHTIWIGTDGGGVNSYHPETGVIRNYPFTEGMKVTTLEILDSGSLLMSIYQKGLAVFDKRSGRVEFLELSNKFTGDKIVNYEYFRTLVCGDILFFAESVYYKFDKTDNTLQRYKSRNENFLPTILSATGNETAGKYGYGGKNIYQFCPVEMDIAVVYSHSEGVSCCTVDGAGDIWFADVANKLYHYDIERKFLTEVLSCKGEAITSIVAGNRVWYATRSGVYCYDKTTKESFFLGENEGVNVNEYLKRCAYVSTCGDVYLAGVVGLQLIRNTVEFAAAPSYNAKLISAKIDDVKIPFSLSSSVPPLLTVNWDYASLELGVVSKGINIFQPQAMRLSVVGVEGEVLSLTSNSSIITLPRMPIGEYSVFISFATQGGGFLEPQILAAISVFGPWWKTNILYVVITLTVLLLLVLCFILIFRIKKRRMQKKFSLKQQELTKQRLEFMTSMSHELRTPLTLIMSPLNKIKKNISEGSAYYKEVSSMHSEVLKMKKLVDLGLNIQRIEEGGMELNIKKINLKSWCEGCIGAFLTEFENKGISLVLEECRGDLTLNMDEDKCYIILSNLLMNALKYSPSGTSVRVSCKGNGESVIFEVADEGKGVDEALSESIFQFFYQENSNSSGFGIGLAYCKRLVKAHKGEIGVRSNESGGATFYFSIPSSLVLSSYGGEVLEFKSDVPALKPEVLAKLKNYTLMVVDDNGDIVKFLKDELSLYFKKVCTSANGQQALDIIREQVPDLVISDIMMPLMNGYELCSAIKNDVEVSHIPVILLTAKDDERSRSMGYKQGADNYISKPFDMDMLINLITNELMSREAIKNRFALFNEVLSPSEGTFSNADEKFMNKVNQLIMGNIDNPELDTAMMYSALHMSRSTFQNKFKAITNTSVNKYVNLIRIEKAKELMTQGELILSEVAYKVGFSSASYFSTVFRQYEGVSPKVFLEEMNKN